ncbi:aminotransferase [Sporolactobacillus terrae]|uniref:Aminotransferase n=1 Tax=Sporolactobacillus terrae TaxID=269673 RepID=A0A5K7X6B0_9BACL|nr:aminotransferase [Sporolactobacillus terrae]BBN99376.1 aminotransferase [Sporolactobacillus terrae]
MKIKPFQVEEWMNAYETKAVYNIAETCVDSVSLQKLFDLAEADIEAFWKRFSLRRLTYGDIEGHPEFLQGICRQYRTIRPQHIIPTHGAAGANHLVLSALVGPGDHVISVQPTYQQLYSIPESMGAKVDILHLRKENQYLPDLIELRQLITDQTKLVCINNPNNPTGALMDNQMLGEIVEICRNHGVYLLCDEVYRHLTQDDLYSESIVDLYEKGISVSSMSKVWSLAGLRLGWVVTKDQDLRKACLSHRDYNLISCGLFDEEVAAIALKHSGKLLERNRMLVRTNLNIIKQWVEKEPDISFVMPQAGTTALLHYNFDMNARDFCKGLLEKNGVLLTPGDCFEEPRCLRIGYACNTEELKGGLDKMHEYITHVKER